MATWRLNFDDEAKLDLRKGENAGWPSVVIMLSPADGNVCSAYVTYDEDPLGRGRVWLEWPKTGVAAGNTYIDSCAGPVTGVKVARTLGSAPNNLALIYDGAAIGWHSQAHTKG